MEKKNPWGICVHKIWHANISVGMHFQYFFHKEAISTFYQPACEGITMEEKTG